MVKCVGQTRGWYPQSLLCQTMNIPQYILSLIPSFQWNLDVPILAPWKSTSKKCVKFLFKGDKVIMKDQEKGTYLLTKQHISRQVNSQNSCTHNHLAIASMKAHWIPYHKVQISFLYSNHCCKFRDCSHVWVNKIIYYANIEMLIRIPSTYIKSVPPRKGGASRRIAVVCWLASLSEKWPSAVQWSTRQKGVSCRAYI